MNATTSEPRLTAEQLETIADEIATFAARIDVANHALLTRLRIFDAHEAWGPLGFSSCAAWLSWRVGLGLTAAREKVRVARALGSLPKLDAVFSQGELSYSKVRAITRVATPQTEQDFIDVAGHATASQIERLARSYRDAVERADVSPQSQQQREESRYVRRSTVAGGMKGVSSLQLWQGPPRDSAAARGGRDRLGRGDVGGLRSPSCRRFRGSDRGSRVRVSRVPGVQRFRGSVGREVA